MPVVRPEPSRAKVQRGSNVNEKVAGQCGWWEPSVFLEYRGFADFLLLFSKKKRFGGTLLVLVF